MRPFRGLTESFTVWLVNRRPGMAPGTTLQDLADDYADAVAARFPGSVPVIGVSTGASIAQLLAARHPGLVSRLVLVAGAHRLSERGRAAQRSLARHIEAGHPGRAWAATGPLLGGTVAGRSVLTVLLWLLGRRMTPPDPADLCITVAAEDAFDAWPDLPRITAPTLIIGGARDGFYTPELFRATAHRIPGARLVLYPRKGHVATVAGRATARTILQFLSAAGGGGHAPDSCASHRRPF
jgi:pimeloyl-ACP methyl ester carboxylesterase